MELFLIGLLFGALGYRFLDRLLRGRPPFDWLLQRELGAESLPAAAEVLEKRVANLEEELQKLSGARIDSSPADKNDEMAMPLAAAAEQPLLYPGGRAYGGKQPGINRRAARSNVIALWREGKEIDDIATRTRLGRGEVELIINLQEKMKAASRKRELGS
jgi:hypothetical protein